MIVTTYELPVNVRIGDVFKTTPSLSPQMVRRRGAGPWTIRQNRATPSSVT